MDYAPGTERPVLARAPSTCYTLLAEADVPRNAASSGAAAVATWAHALSAACDCVWLRKI
jgi:hypothetical protein